MSSIASGKIYIKLDYDFIKNKLNTELYSSRPDIYIKSDHYFGKTQLRNGLYSFRPNPYSM